MLFPEAYIDYLAHFHGTRDFFECHEVLEEYWKAHPRDPLSSAYVVLIQIAVSAYHERRGNQAGAVKMLLTAIKGLSTAQMEALGLHGEKLRLQMEQRLKTIQSGLPYEDPLLPMIDGELFTASKQRCSQIGAVWGSPSDSNNEALIHRHKLRDRSAVIDERRRQLELKANQRKLD